MYKILQMDTGEDTKSFFGFVFLATLVGWLQGWQRQWVAQSVHRFDLDLNISTTTSCIAIKFGTDIWGSQTISPNNFGDSNFFLQGQQEDDMSGFE